MAWIAWLVAHIHPEETLASGRTISFAVAKAPRGRFATYSIKSASVRRLEASRTSDDLTNIWSIVSPK